MTADLKGGAVKMAQGAKTMSGNAGIGTTSPSYKLDVIGDIRVTGSVYYGGTDGNADGTAYTKPDFVFEDGYKVMEIDEVEAYIESIKHLLWVTSSQNEEENAVNMTRMGFETLEALENLQMQIIKLNKEIELLKEENKELRVEIDK